MINRHPSSLTRSVLGTVVIFSFCTGLLLAWVSPWFLGNQAGATVASSVKLGSSALLVIGVATALQLRPHQYTVRSLILGTRSIEPQDLFALARVPWTITFRVLVLAFVFSLLLLLPGVRGRDVDFKSSLLMTLLADMFFFTAALPLNMLLRRQVANFLQLAPEQSLREMLDLAKGFPLYRWGLHGRILAAVVMPVALVGLGTALLAYVHVAAFEVYSRVATASAVAESVLEPIPGPLPYAGQREAIERARAAGFNLRVARGKAHFSVKKRADGNTKMVMTGDDIHANMSFVTSTIPALTTDGIVTAIVSILVALVVALLLGRALSEDLSHAIRDLESLGTDQVLDGQQRFQWQPRFSMAGSFFQAVEQMSGRFRVFASTQEKAIGARDAARRLRGLLFASVSHDLKNALNSILGFAGLIAEPLNSEQQQSLSEVQRSGRELLSLVENILDAARVEAGQLVLTKQTSDLREVLRLATYKADQVKRPNSVPLQLHLPNQPSLVYVDKARIAGAIATLLIHARRTCSDGVISVSMKRTSAGNVALIDIDTPSRALSAREIRHLMTSDRVAPVPNQRQGALPLGLSLARALFLLHDGTATAHDTKNGVTYELALPIESAHKRLSPESPQQAPEKNT